ncbi:MAG TPA: hypothetical protein VGV40_11005 [Solirubrobacteraceae bacterium]|nr:hypothetical protein [Solirubrobacteraceae bacterium]
MARRRRKGRPGEGGQARAPEAVPGGAVDDPEGSSPGDAMARGYARSRARDDALRAGLTPLGPDERPLALVICSLLAGGLALANLVLWLAGLEIQGERPGAAGVLVFCGLMLAAAVGMWQKRYWAVLGFQALLAVNMLVAFLSLLRAANALAVLIPVVVLAGGGWLFWRLIRIMARLQTPSRSGGGADR